MARDRLAPMLLVKLRTNTGDEFRMVTDQVLAFKYQDRERKADLCKLTVDNSDLSNFDDPAWRKGARLIVQWGYPDAMSPARQVVITSVKGFKELEIEAVALSVLMNRVQKCRIFENRKISQIVRSIAAENGFGSDQQHVDDTGEVLSVVNQSRLTDAQFIRRWASRVGFEFYVDFDGLHFHERRVGARPIRVFRYHIDPNQGDILAEPTIENDLTARPGRSRVRGRNPMTREDINETADNDSDNDRDTLTEVVEIIDPDTGNASTVERTLASEEVVPTADTTPAAAQQRARGRFRRAQQVAIKMKFPIIGDPLLLSKSVVKIEGMGRRLSVRYYLEDVDHDLGTNGYTCNLKLVSDGHGGHSTRSNRAVGLSAFGVGARGPGSGRGVNQQVVQLLRSALEAAQSAGDTQSAGVIQTALQGYQRRGNAARSDLAQLLSGVVNNSSASVAVRQKVSAVLGALAQRTEETESGGNPNRQDPQEDAAEVLEPFDIVDPDTGQTRTAYRQSPSRGTTTGGES